MGISQQELLQVERGFWNGDPGFFEEHMDERAISVIEPMGFVEKEAAVKAAEQAEGWKDLEIRDVKTIELTPESAAIAYHAEARTPAGKPYRASINSVYVKRNGSWKLALTSHQPWPEPPKA